MIIAYLDANSGSLLVSAVAAGFAGVGVAFKFGWRKVTRGLRPSRPVSVEPSSADRASKN